VPEDGRPEPATKPRAEPDVRDHETVAPAAGNLPEFCPKISQCWTGSVKCRDQVRAVFDNLLELQARLPTAAAEFAYFIGNLRPCDSVAALRRRQAPPAAALKSGLFLERHGS
jgi:hypothetical protein